ncbi:MAG: hypothetical protein C0429_17370 [Sphingopyxis sp.]|nr:hypothetical protein [Sphingopyxis sp.]
MAIDGPTTNAPVLLTHTMVAGFKSFPTPVEYKDLGAKGLRLRVGSTGKKTWVMRVRAGDKILNRKLGVFPAMSLTTARTTAQQLVETIGRDGNTESLDRTFKEVAEQWIEKVAKPKNTSWKQQQRKLEMYVYPKWADKKIADIRRPDVRDLIERIEGFVLPNRVLATIKPIFGFAVSRDWIDASPADRVEKPKKEEARDRFLSIEEIARVWHASDLLGYPFGQYVKVLLLTGQRRTSVASMRWESLDLAAGTWTMRASETKSKRAHLVPLSPLVLDILNTLPRMGPFVFSTDGKTHISNFTKVKSKLDTFILADDKGEMAGWRFHDLRRSTASLLQRLGVPLEVIGKVLDHASQGVTAKVYALYKYEPEKRNALDRWAAEVDRVVNGRGDQKVVELRTAR